MSCNQLTQVADHIAWKQRVDRELGNQNKFRDIRNESFYNQSKHGGGFLQDENCICKSTYIAPFVRMNRDRRDLKQLGGYFNDSTYINASDPNSMIDQGMVRNAVYSAYIDQQCNGLQGSSISQQRTRSSNRRMTGQSFNTVNSSQGHRLGKSVNYNNTFYSFGGKTPINLAICQQPELNQTFSSIPRDYQQRERYEQRMVIYNHDPLVRVNDYTKNVSQSIFSPGLVKKIRCVRNKFSQQQQQQNQTNRRGGAEMKLLGDSRKMRPQSCANLSQFKRTQDQQKVKSIENMLDLEKKRREKLQKDISNLKMMLSSISNKGYS